MSCVVGRGRGQSGRWMWMKVFEILVLMAGTRMGGLGENVEDGATKIAQTRRVYEYE